MVDVDVTVFGILTVSQHPTLPKRTQQSRSRIVPFDRDTIILAEDSVPWESLIRAGSFSRGPH
jgi:hypothetical protein